MSIWKWDWTKTPFLHIHWFVFCMFILPQVICLTICQTRNTRQHVNEENFSKLFWKQSIRGLYQITELLLIYQHRDSFEACMLSNAPVAPSPSLTAGHLAKATCNSLNANARRVAENEEINEQEASNIRGVISLSHFHAKWDIFCQSRWHTDNNSNVALCEQREWRFRLRQLVATSAQTQLQAEDDWIHSYAWECSYTQEGKATQTLTGSLWEACYRQTLQAMLVMCKWSYHTNKLLPLYTPEPLNCHRGSCHWPFRSHYLLFQLILFLWRKK